MSPTTKYNLNNKAEAEALLKSYGFSTSGIDYVDRANAETLLSLGFRPLRLKDSSKKTK